MTITLKVEAEDATEWEKVKSWFAANPNLVKTEEPVAKTLTVTLIEQKPVTHWDK